MINHNISSQSNVH